MEWPESVEPTADQELGAGARRARSEHVSQPRPIHAGRFAMLTRRCAQRQFLLSPGAVMNAIFLYCLAVASQRFGIFVLLTTVMSDHHHTIVYDPSGRVVEFIEYLHRFVAKAGNVLRGRRENFWSSDEPSIVYLETLEDVLEKLVYVATNPVKDGLVEQAVDWPGVSTYAQLLSGEEISIERPSIFFRSNGPMPERATLCMKIPSAFCDRSALLTALRDRVGAFEARTARERRAASTTVVGPRRVLSQSWLTCASTPEKPRAVRPRFAARQLAARRAALALRREFLTAYRAARELWLAGLAAVFPPGTYWLRRFAGVTVAPS